LETAVKTVEELMEEALTEIGLLITLDPALDSSEGKRLLELAKFVEWYEKDILKLFVENRRSR
jgi:hypothetical protein